MNNSNNDYTVRIAQATPNELNIINFEICILNLNIAIENLEIDKKLFEEKLDVSLLALKELIISLNLEYEISKELRELYLFVNKILIHSKYTPNKQELLDCVEILNTIKIGFESIEDKNAKPVVQNASKVFAGLTYGKNGKLTEYIDDSSSSGFKA